MRDPSAEEAKKPSEKIVCPICAYGNQPGTRFCIICGTALSTVPTPPPAAEPEPEEPELPAEEPSLPVPEETPAEAIRPEEPEEKTCPVCGSACSANMRFCTVCGHRFVEMAAGFKAPVESKNETDVRPPKDAEPPKEPELPDTPEPPKAPEAADTKVCPACGRSCEAGMKFCNYCGNKFPVPPAAVPVPDILRDLRARRVPGSPEPSPSHPTGTDVRREPEPRICPSCGRTCMPGMKFCTNCGTRLEQPATDSTEKRCRTCGATLEPNQRFCMECGTPV